MKQGEKELGITSDVSLCFRYGVFEKTDVGLKAFRFPAFGYSLFCDTKYNFPPQPFLISADLVFTVSSLSDPIDPDPGLQTRIYGIHPIILFGEDHIYGGIGWNSFVIREDIRSMDKPPFMIGFGIHRVIKKSTVK